METCIWTGKSGKQYAYGIYHPSANWNPIGGNYIFASIFLGRWVAHYIGQTDNFRTRFASHEKWDEAVRAGATHILAHTNADTLAKLNEEFDLIQSNSPSCNVQHQPGIGLSGLSSLLNFPWPPAR